MERNCRYGYFIYKSKGKNDVAQLINNLRISKTDFIELNDKKAEEVTVGEQVKIPYRLSGCGKGRFYRLNRNESLPLVAQRQKVKLSQLLENNPFLNPASYMPNQIIILPEKRSREYGDYLAYTVAAGDTLADILRRFDISIRELQLSNKNCDVFNLKKGQVLYIKKDNSEKRRHGYILKQNESLSTVTKKFNTSVIEILKANPHLRPLEIREGTNIILPV